MADRAADALRIEYCGEWWNVDPPGPFVIGREGDLAVDDNEYLHRAFLSLRWDRFWWIDNVGSRLSATICDADGTMQSWIAPGGTLPVLFRSTEVRFTAGPTSYLLAIHLSDPLMVRGGVIVNHQGATTLQPVTLTERQRCVVLALAEPALLGNERSPSTIPTSAAAAQRLAWRLTTFNRQLDAVCQKLASKGARGLHGGAGNLASSRRARLVEYALATRLVSADDLPLLDHMRQESEPG